MVEAVGDVVEAVGDVVEAVGEVVEAVDVVTGGGVQMCWGIPKEFPQTDANVFPHMRIVWGGCRFLLLRVVFVFRPLPLDWTRCR